MSDNTGRPGLPAPPGGAPTETTRVPAPAGGRRRAKLPGNFAHAETRAPDRGRSLDDGLAELQRRRTEGEPGRRKRRPRSETYTAPDGTRIPIPLPSAPPAQPPTAFGVTLPTPGQPRPTTAGQPQQPTAADATAAALASLVHPGAVPGPEPAPAVAPSPRPGIAPALAAGDALQPISLVVDGQLVNLPLGEVVAGYLRTRDYSAKTQQAAIYLRQAQEAQGQFNQARERLEQRLAQVLALDGDEFARPIDWEALSKTDPIGYIQKRARFQNRQDLLAEQNRLAEIRQREETGRKAYALATGHQTLTAIIPGWSDPARRGQIQARMLAHLVMRGFTDDEIGKREMIDPREVVILLESMLWGNHASQGMPQPQPVGAATLAGNGQFAGAATREGAPIDLGGFDERFARTRKLDDAVELLRARRAAEAAGVVAGAPLRPNGRN